MRPGSGYTYANVDFSAGRVYRTPSDLDANQNGLNPRGEHIPGQRLSSHLQEDGVRFRSSVKNKFVGVFSS